MKFAWLLLLTSCVSLKTHEERVRDSYTAGLERAKLIARMQNCEDAEFVINGAIEVEKMKK